MNTPTHYAFGQSILRLVSYHGWIFTKRNTLTVARYITERDNENRYSKEFGNASGS